MEKGFSLGTMKHLDRRNLQTVGTIKQPQFDLPEEVEDVKRGVDQDV
jgi:hypothetical protein